MEALEPIYKSVICGYCVRDALFTKLYKGRAGVGSAEVDLNVLKLFKCSCVSG